MGCGNSSPATSSSSSSSSSSTGGRADREISNEAEDDKRKNYGGVYLGLPSDLSTIPQVQIGPLREICRDSASLRKSL
ncbi:overexpressed in colon carcinoma 1 protein homolog [Echeneis naucrates]|uniref:overexpressed in colon carcinoma 1 protein homolog n=1 Tax=Echeneis naucrates TaxID=173247 RepID=UPI0011139BF0|nr:overexpressed in colon carcinoma 1 protein homolog [Echeneis naucrates]